MREDTVERIPDRPTGGDSAEGSVEGKESR